MKPSNGVQKEDLKHKGLMAKRLAYLERKSKMKQQNQKRLRFVRSVHAGHVRGGHSFH